MVDCLTLAISVHLRLPLSVCAEYKWLRRVCAFGTEQEKNKPVETHEAAASRVKLWNRKEPQLKKREAGRP